MDATKSKPDASMAAAIEHAASGMMQSTWKFFLPDSDKPPPPKPVGDDERIIDIIGEQIETVFTGGKPAKAALDAAAAATKARFEALGVAGKKREYPELFAD